MKFTIGQSVTYKPGFGTYGYEDTLQGCPGGRIPCTVEGFTRTRVRIRVQTDRGMETRAVDAGSLRAEP